MNWINGLQNAINYVEDHLTEEIDYEKVAEQSFSSNYHFQRIFGILCGYTLGEYIRNRRLTLAGTELQTGNSKVIDIALKYGYESPDSFAKAFQRFHGCLPSQARSAGVTLKSFSRLSVNISLEGGSIMNYRIEEKPAMTLTGYKKHFTGTPARRADQECDFYVTTRVNQYLLKGLAGDRDTSYSIITNVDDEGYDFYIAAALDEWTTENLDKTLGYAEEAKRFDKIPVPAGLYLICETERCQYPTMIYEDLRKKAVNEWLPSSDYELREAPELSVTHWFYRHGDEGYNQSRYMELWLPIGKRNETSPL